MNPFVKTRLDEVVTAVEVHVPPVLVTSPVKVFTPVLLASEMIPVVEVVPPTVKVAVFKLSVAPLFTVRLPASDKANEPAPNDNAPLTPLPITMAPTLFAGETSSVIVWPSWIVITQPEHEFWPG